LHPESSRPVSCRLRLSLLVLLALLLAPGERTNAIVLQHTDFLLSTGGDLLVVGPERVPTRLGSLDPQEAQIDSQGRIVFRALDRHLSFARIFRWTPTTGEREVLYEGDMVIYHFALESDTSAVVSGVRTVGGIVRGVFRIDFATGQVAPVSSGGFLDEFSPLAVDPTDGSIVVFAPSAVVRVHPGTGQQTPVAFSSGFNSVVAVDPTGRIFVFRASGGVSSTLSLVDEETQALEPLATTFRIDDMVFEPDGSLLALARTSHLTSFYGLVRIDVDAEVPAVDEFAPVPAAHVAVDGSGRIFVSGFSGTPPPEIENQPAIVQMDPETGASTTLFQKPLGTTGHFARGAVVRPAEAGGDELIVFLSSGRIVRLDPRDGLATSVVAPGGLLSPAPLAPNPIVAVSREVLFLNDGTSSLLALRPDGTLRFVSSGNLIDEPGAVAEEPGGGSYLVASGGSVNPGLVRVSDAGVQSTVVPGSSSFRVLEVVRGRLHDAVIRVSDGLLHGVDTGDGALIEIPTEPFGRFVAGQDGVPLVFAAPAGAAGIYALDESSGLQALVALTPDVPSAVHVHAVPEPSRMAAGAAFLAIAWLARRARTRTLQTPA
jgi:hypothetical protein